MGVDLKLLPLLHGDFWTAHTILDVNRRRELWPEIAAQVRDQVPEPVNCYLAIGKDGDPAYGPVAKDPYGSPLTWCTAGNLWSLKLHRGVQDNWQNKAIWEFLGQMPKDWKIVLFWC